MDSMSLPHFSPFFPNVGTPHSPFFPTPPLGGGESGDGETRGPDICSFRWILQFVDREPVPVVRFPPATWAEVMADSPDAVAAEPAPELTDERDNTAPPSCTTCTHHRRAGLTGAGCIARNDLPELYGERHPLPRLPVDGGKDCRHWTDNETTQQPHDQYQKRKDHTMNASTIPSNITGLSPTGQRAALDLAGFLQLRAVFAGIAAVTRPESDEGLLATTGHALAEAYVELAAQDLPAPAPTAKKPARRRTKSAKVVPISER